MVHWRGREGATVAEHFSVTYDGPAVTEHRMPVTDLAPALLYLSEMFVTAHRVIGDGATRPPSLDVVAHNEGSFDVSLVLDAARSTVDLLNEPEVTAATVVVTLLSPVVKALEWVRHVRRVGVPANVEPLEPGTIRVRFSDGTSMECTASAADLVDSMDFRRAAAGALSPLNRDDGGIETVEIRPEQESAEIGSVTLDRGDLHELERPVGDTERVLADSVRTVGLRPLKPSFEAGYKWWVSDGTSKFWVDMHDLAFLQRVETSSETFSAGDILRCRVRDRQVQDAEGVLRMEHYVLQVIEHLRMPPPDPLPLPSN